MDALEALALAAGGLAAGVINAVAGGGSMLTVPMLVLVGVGGADANGTNRLGLLFSQTASVGTFGAAGVHDTRMVLRTLVPVGIGALAGGIAVGALGDESFERVFGLLMVPILVMSLWPPKPPPDPARDATIGWKVTLVLGLIGVYGGAFQVGIGLLLLAALSRTHLDLVTANAVKMGVSLIVTLVAFPVFVLRDEVRWWPGVVLGVGFAVGGWVGARLAIRRGERLIRAAMVVAVLVLSTRLIGFWG